MHLELSRIGVIHLGDIPVAEHVSVIGRLQQRVDGRRDVISAASSDTVADAVMRMKDRGVSQLPVLDGDRLVGILTESDVLGKLVEGAANLSSAVAEVMFRNVTTVNEADDAGVLTDLFSNDLVAVVVDDGVGVEVHKLGDRISCHGHPH